MGEEVYPGSFDLEMAFTLAHRLALAMMAVTILIDRLGYLRIG